MAYFAELEANTKRVLRVVVADTIAWPQTRLGGDWVETMLGDPQLQYAGIGMYQSDVVPRKFCPAWKQPAGSFDAYNVGDWVWHNGQVWENLMAANVWEPGVTGWRDPLNEWPAWVQPLGAQDAYKLGAKVTYAGQRWINTGSDANVWAPGVFGWTVQP